MRNYILIDCEGNPRRATKVEILSKRPEGKLYEIFTYHSVAHSLDVDG